MANTPGASKPDKTASLSNQPTHYASDVKNKAQDVAHSVADKARDAANTASDKARDVASNVADKAKEIGSTVSDKAREYVDKAKDYASTLQDSNPSASVASGMQSLASNIRQAAPREGMIGTASTSLADSLESGSRYLQEHGFGEMAEDVTTLIRRNPIPAVLIGIGVGFLLARSIRS